MIDYNLYWQYLGNVSSPLETSGFRLECGEPIKKRKYSNEKSNKYYILANFANFQHPSN